MREQGKKPNITPVTPGPCLYCGTMGGRMIRNGDKWACADPTPCLARVEANRAAFCGEPVLDRTTNLAAVPDEQAQPYRAGVHDERARIEPELQRLRKERDDARNEVKAAELRGAMEAEKRIERIIEAHEFYEEGDRNALLAAIREGDDA